MLVSNVLSDRPNFVVMFFSHKLQHKLNGFRCADVLECHSHSVHFGGHLLRGVLTKSAVKCRQ